jgi:hypothetical protein
MALKTTLARKAVKTTAKHTAHGASSKLKRDPLRASTLIGLGALIGAAAVWALSHFGGSADESFPTAPTVNAQI